MGRLWECGNKLRDPGLASKFIWWVHFTAEQKAEKAYAESLRVNDTLEGQLRYANYELNQLKIVKAAQDDELKGMHQKVELLSSTVNVTREQLTEAISRKRELAELSELYKDTKEELDEAEKRMEVLKTELAESRGGKRESGEKAVA